MVFGEPIPVRVVAPAATPAFPPAFPPTAFDVGFLVGFRVGLRELFGLLFDAPGDDDRRPTALARLRLRSPARFAAVALMLIAVALLGGRWSSPAAAPSRSASNSRRRRLLLPGALLLLLPFAALLLLLPAALLLAERGLLRVRSTETPSIPATLEFNVTPPTVTPPLSVSPPVVIARASPKVTLLCRRRPPPVRARPSRPPPVPSPVPPVFLSRPRLSPSRSPCFWCFMSSLSASPPCFLLTIPLGDDLDDVLVGVFDEKVQMSSSKKSVLRNFYTEH